MLEQIINKSIKETTRDSFRGFAETVPKTIYNFLVERLPYRPTSIKFKCFYNACLYNILNIITLPKYLDRYDINTITYERMNHVLDKQEDNCIIMYDLDYKYEKYLTVLIKELKWVLALDMSRQLHWDLDYSSNLINLMWSRTTDEETIS